MSHKKLNTYEDLTYDIQPLRGVMIEKFIAPDFHEGRIMIWHDKNGEYHSFNGFPSIIEERAPGRVCQFLWHHHGKQLKTQLFVKPSESELIAQKLQLRNFQERAKKK